jgi:hypothetical protein
MQKYLGPLGQIGYVVADLKEAATGWVERTGIGPWYIAEHVPLDYFQHRQSPSDIEIGIATAFTGSLEIELIVQHNDSPSDYVDTLNRSGAGVHHICFFPLNYDLALTSLLSQDFEILQNGAIHGIRFIYLMDPENQVVEMADLPDDARKRRKSRMAEAADWDGSDPIRSR